MEWSKVKNCIIVILVCVNLSLLGLVGIREGKAAQYREEARADILAALDKNGIRFAPEEFPGDMALSPVTVTRSRDGEQAMAEALLGQVEREDTGGGVRVVYTGAQGSAVFSSDGRFEFSLSPQARPLAEAAPAQDGRDCLDLLGIRASLVEILEIGEETRLVYRQDWDGAPIFSNQIVLSYQSGALRSVSGDRLAGAAAPGAAAALSTPTVLLRFLSGINEGGYVCSRIDSMIPGYLASSGAARPAVQLSPVWYLDTDTGAYYVDGVTGALSRAE